jgi:hypothetical protein
MNERYRKQRRLRSRHARRGHTPWCRCPEEITRMLLAVRRLFGSWNFKDIPQ